MTQNATAPRTVTFAVADMSCDNCVRHISEALKGAFGDLPFQVDLAQHRLTVTLDAASPSVDAIAAVMDEEGYPVTVI